MPITDWARVSPTARVSLGQRAGLPLVVALGIAGVLAGIVCYRVPALAGARWIAMPALVVPPVLGLVLAQLVIEPSRARRELAWLEALPFPFARDAYLEVLGRRRSENSFELLVHFAAPVSQTTLDAAAEAFGVTSAFRARGPTTYVFTSPTAATKTESSGARAVASSYDNRALHRWFRERAAPLLVDLVGQGLTHVEIGR